MQRTWMLAALAGMAGFAVAGAIARDLRRARRARGLLREQVQAWENEGGNVPEVPAVNPGQRHYTRVRALS